MNTLTPAEKVAAYVHAALGELKISQAELARRVGSRVGRPYSTTVAKGWLKLGNAPADVLYALYEMSGISLDLYAGMRERQPATDERLAALENKFDRLVADLEQLRREAGLPYRRIDEDSNEPDDAAAYAE